MTTKTSKILAEIADREAIKECLARYSRGVDRMEPEMVLSAYWPDAIDERMDFRGNPQEFVDWCLPHIAAMGTSQHYLCNILMNVNGNTADVETYFQVYMRVNTPDGDSDVLTGGRYADRFEKRDDEWRIIDRYCTTDWFRIFPGAADWAKGMMGFMMEPPGRGPADESYKRLKIA